ncbi:rCG39212 [Rattus norvegicus]|uniref:RCG39212 n=1 Tax=Rattus norvegicus TaxID=10116 RepID=A6KML6_RAT|nr:rCG39212 [Rattus norvegicus]
MESWTSLNFFPTYFAYSNSPGGREEKKNKEKKRPKNDLPLSEANEDSYNGQNVGNK